MGRSLQFRLCRATDMREILPILSAIAWSLAPLAIISAAIRRFAVSEQIWQGRPGMLVTST
jgi:hypothetical protein